MNPITPAKYYDGKLGVTLPENLLPAFVFLSEASLTRPEIAAFGTFYLAAWAGNPDALKKVLELVLAVHYLATHNARPKDQTELAVVNAIVYLGNKLAEAIEAGRTPQIEEKQQPPKPQAPKAPVKAEQQKKPARKIDPKIKFVKPGTARQEK